MLRPRVLVPGLLLLVMATLLLDRSSVVFQEGQGTDRIRVVERSDGVRTLYLGTSRGRQTAMHPDRPLDLELPYTRVAMAALPLVGPEARILFVGLGGGAMPRYVREVLPRARLDAVELDPRVVEVAREWFDLPTDSLLAVHVMEGRSFIERSPGDRWDLVVLDAFADGRVPRSLATVEFLREVARVVAPGGVVASNLHTTDPDYEAMLATYAAVFPGVALLDVPRRRQVIVLAGDGDTVREERLLEAALAFQAERDVGFDLSAVVTRGWKSFPEVDRSVLTDAR